MKRVMKYHDLRQDWRMVSLTMVKRSIGACWICTMMRSKMISRLVHNIFHVDFARLNISFNMNRSFYSSLEFSKQLGILSLQSGHGQGPAHTST